MLYRMLGSRKYMFICLLMIPLSVSAQHDNSDFYITGKISDAEKDAGNTMAYLMGFSTRQMLTDSCLIENGVFSFRGSISEPLSARLWLVHQGNKQGKKKDTKLFYLESGHTHFATKDSIKNATVSGSPITLDMYAYLALTDSVKDEQAKYNRLRSSRKSDSTFIAQVVRPALAKIKLSYDSIRKVFIENHPESIYSLEVLDQLVLNSMYDKKRNELTAERVEAIRTLFSGLSVEVRESVKGQSTRLAMDGLSSGKVGDEVIPFVGVDPHGDTVDIRQFKGKIFLIDFWGSWCAWCRKGHPHLMELYNNYHDKGFEIIAVASEAGDMERQQTRWKKAIEKDGVPWVHILNSTADVDVVTAYGVSAYPTKILVDQDGEILLRVTGISERELDVKLEELFGQDQP